eukprot:3586609-Lingulodinium_polyedra.AAC.1
MTFVPSGAAAEIFSATTSTSPSPGANTRHRASRAAVSSSTAFTAAAACKTRHGTCEAAYSTDTLYGVHPTWICGQPKY